MPSFDRVIEALHPKLPPLRNTTSTPAPASSSAPKPPRTHPKELPPSNPGDGRLNITPTRHSPRRPPRQNPRPVTTRHPCPQVAHSHHLGYVGVMEQLETTQQELVMAGHADATQGDQDPTKYLIREATQRLLHHVQLVEDRVQSVTGLTDQLRQIAQMQAALRALDAPSIPALRPLEELVMNGTGGGARARQPGSAPPAGVGSPAHTSREGRLATLEAMRRVMTSNPQRAWAPAELAEAMVNEGWVTEATDRVRLVTARLQKLLKAGRVAKPARAEYLWLD